jgi:hypothetical protein
MRNVLFSQRTRALPLNDSRVPACDGTNGIRATVERHMRFEFVRGAMLPTATSIPALQMHAIEQGGDTATSPAF